MTHLAALLRTAALRSPQRLAISFAAEQIGYGELDRRAGRVAHQLRAAGVAPGRHVAILAKGHPAFFAAWFGAMQAGAVLVPVNFRLSAAEIAWVLRDAVAEVLFVGPEYVDLVRALAADLPALRTIVVLGTAPPAWQSYDDWIAPGPQWHDAVAHDIALLIYTSSTSGQSKGAQPTHAGLRADLERYDTLGYWREDDVMLSVMPLIHLGGVGFGLRAIYRAAHLVLLPEFDAAAVLAALVWFKATKMLVVPTMLRWLLDHPDCAATDFAALDTITYGAAPMPVALLQRALPVFKCRFGTGYGLTESGGAITWLGPEDHRVDAVERLRSCGKPSGAAIRVVDATGRDLPTGEIGEIVISSPQTMRGYWNAPQATADVLRAGWLHSGDAGYFDADGYLVICDRIKDMIVSGGENIYPVEVEDALLAHAAVAEVAIIGVPDERWGEAPRALVVCRRGAAPGAARDDLALATELTEFLRARVAAYKLPRSFEFVDSLPRNAAGKVQKRLLRAPYWAGLQRQVN